MACYEELCWMFYPGKTPRVVLFCAAKPADGDSKHAVAVAGVLLVLHAWHFATGHFAINRFCNRTIFGTVTKCSNPKWEVEIAASLRCAR